MRKEPQSRVPISARSTRDGAFALRPPIEPMLAKPNAELPAGDFLYEPKWDGFRAIVFRGDEVYIQSRDLRPLDRYFPDLHQGLSVLPPGCVLDGEIVILRDGILDFDALQLRLHPAASRAAKLARETPAAYVAFDALAIDGRDLRALPQLARRAALEQLLNDVGPPVQLTPMTTDRALAQDWFVAFERLGLDGVIAKPATAPYQPGKRAMIKVKHARTADCVVAGFRWYRREHDAVGSLLLGLFDADDVLHHVGVVSSFGMPVRRHLVAELAPLREHAASAHPWVQGTAPEGVSRPGGHSRWSAGKDLAWEPLRLERVCEVKYDHLQGDRFRHATTFIRWRPDKRPEDCRYDQLKAIPS